MKKIILINNIIILLVLILITGCSDLFDNEHEEIVRNNKVAGLPVYNIGGNNLMLGDYQSRAISQEDFFKIEKEHILIIPGGTSVSKDILEKDILAGNPVLVIGNTDSAKNLFKGQYNTGIADGRTPDGKKIKETAFGYLYSDTYSKTFITSEEDIYKAVKLGLDWVERVLNEKESPTTRETATFSYVYQRDYTTGDAWNPYGRLNVRTVFYKLSNDDNTTYDWYNVNLTQQSVPGPVLNWGNWYTADMYTWLDADYHNSSYMLADYSPTTTSGSSTTSVSVGVSAGSSGASVSASSTWSYTTSDVMVLDSSDYSVEYANWRHDVAEDKNVGKYTYQIQPGACVRVPNGYPISWKEHYGIVYATTVWWWWVWSSEGWVEFW